MSANGSTVNQLGHQDDVSDLNNANDAQLGNLGTIRLPPVIKRQNSKAKTLMNNIKKRSKAEDHRRHSATHRVVPFARLKLQNANPWRREIGQGNIPFGDTPIGLAKEAQIA
uniref:Uncharacterized protein n=1 Tax=Solanum tuberosum TaxID=4113 RepID=M1DQK7_SOLTU